MHSVYAPHLNKMVPFGRKRPDPQAPKLHFKKYLLRTLPVPTLPVDYSAKALPSLRNVYLNDQLGDCEIACGAHSRGVTSGNADGCVTFTDAQITQMYGAIGGYVPGNPATDQGCDPVTACNYWVKTGFPDGVKYAGWLAVDANSISELQSAVYLFENLLLGAELPNRYTSPMPSRDGFVWDVAGPPNPQQGHAFLGYGATSQGVLIDTWALFGTLTYAAIAMYCSESANGNVYVALSPDIITKATGKCPAGVDWAGLIADFNAMGGNVPAPGPTPSPTPIPPAPVPVPVPVPTPIISLQQVLGYIDQAFTLIERSNPYMRGLLELVRKDLEAILTSMWPANVTLCNPPVRSLPAHQTLSPTFIDAVIGAVDGAFAAAKADNPALAALLTYVNGMLDGYLRQVLGGL